MLYVLHDMLQRMEFGLLEIIAAVDRIEPHVQEVLGPLAIPQYETARCKPVFVLGDNEIDAVALEVRKRLDDAVGRNDGRVGNHEGLELRRGKQRGVDRERGVHDQRRGVQVPEECGAREHRHGMAHGGDAGP
jgi:hypothetical protein